jgi:HD-GYP domain-containing protein (c-di-GMP phosphodiesterase class II)
MSDQHLLDSIARLTETGLALSREKDIKKLLDMILSSAKSLTNADGGTLYLKSEDGQKLDFAIVRNNKLNINLGGISGNSIQFASVPIYQENGQPNLHNVSAAAAHQGQTINIPDAYSCGNFDFSGTRRFDASTGYRSQSFLTVPMKNHEGDLIGVIQLINALDTQNAVRVFTIIEQSLVESLTSMAATALTQRQLIDAQRNLFDSVVKLIANAIDAKSPYTSGHCQRVPVVAKMLAEAVNADTRPIWVEAAFSDDELYELNVAAWLHDCGKLATPDYIMDKRTKLDGLNDRISEVDARLAALFQGIRADKWEQVARNLAAEANQSLDDVDAFLMTEQQRVQALSAFLHLANQGDEFMAESMQQKVKDAAVIPWLSLAGASPLLSSEEVELLNIARGTLSSQERKIINDHIVVTIDMLKTLPYPKNLKNVVEIAGGHHERVDGKGYPYGLTIQQLSLRARIMAIADVFEALTASDRPYKQPKTLSETLKIMGFMAKEGHIDSDLFNVFVHHKVYLDYAVTYLSKVQIDEVDEHKIVGYNLSA